MDEESDQRRQTGIQAVVSEKRVHELVLTHHVLWKEGRSVLFNDTLNTFYLRLYGVGRKEGNVLFNEALSTFYLLLYGVGRKEGNVLFNDALDTFYLRLYGVGREGRKCFI